MGETNLHKYLKCLGIKYLDEQGCGLIATEIYVTKSASDTWINGDAELKARIDNHTKYLDIARYEQYYKESHDSDSKWIIDVLGIGSVNIMAKDESQSNRFYQPMKKIGTEILVRGIEVKVSRSDFLTGYVQTGLNYHYVLCPELLVKKSEVPKHVGLLYWGGGRSTTVYCAKRPQRMELNTDMFEFYKNSIYGRYHSLIMNMNRDQIKFLWEKV